ncbi:MAG: glycosyltransferase [Candidatus Protistobacter heckmanni]|nr:glycosyltransferase [Candidatus Protistobacter heckmanni]
MATASRIWRGRARRWISCRSSPWDRNAPLRAQIPAGTDIVHCQSGQPEDLGLPDCQTIHGNTREARRFHPNSIFVSADHARNHGARGYAQPDFEARGGPFVFLAKAAWKVKNVRGAIRTARLAGAPLEVLGGHRLNFKMGLRLTLDPNAHFHGMVGDAEKNRWLRGVRGLLFPVRWPEPFGIAVIESLYFGVPVFSTPYGSLPELVGAEAGARWPPARRSWRKPRARPALRPARRARLLERTLHGAAHCAQVFDVLRADPGRRAAAPRPHLIPAGQDEQSAALFRRRIRHRPT